MYTIPKFKKTQFDSNKSVEGETIEMKIDRFINNKETITDKGSIPIYMERKEGVNKAYNIRTDRWEVAVEAMDKVSKSYQARRDEKAKLESGNSDNTDSIHDTTASS